MQATITCKCGCDNLTRQSGSRRTLDIDDIAHSARQGQTKNFIFSLCVFSMTNFSRVLGREYKRPRDIIASQSINTTRCHKAEEGESFFVTNLKVNHRQADGQSDTKQRAVRGRHFIFAYNYYCAHLYTQKYVAYKNMWHFVERYFFCYNPPRTWTLCKLNTFLHFVSHYYCRHVTLLPEKRLSATTHYYTTSDL